MIRSYGSMPPTARKSVIFAEAIGLHPDLVDWWTIAPDFVALAGGDVDSVISRKRDGNQYAGHPLAKVVSGPEYHDGQINGRAAGKFVSSGYDRLEALGILPAGSFSISVVYDAPSTSTIKILTGSQNGNGRFAAYLNQVGGNDYVTATAGTAGSAALVTRPRALGRSRLIVSWDEVTHELALMQNDGVWWTAANPSAEVTQTGFALGAYAGLAGTFDGFVADVTLWSVALHQPPNAATLDLVRRYTGKIFGTGA